MSLTKDVCLCGINVHTGTIIAACVWICLSLLQLTTAFVPEKYKTVTSTYHVDSQNNDQISIYSNYVSESMPSTYVPKIVGALISIVLALLLIVGVTKKIRIAYYPFLVYVALTCALFASVVVLVPLFTLIAAIYAIFAGKASIIFFFYVLIILSLFAFFALLLLAEVYFFFIVPKRSLDLLTEESTARVNDVREKLTSDDPNYV